MQEAKRAEDQFIEEFAAECMSKHGTKMQFEIEMAMRVAFAAGWNQGWDAGAQHGWGKKTHEIQTAVGLFDRLPGA